MQHMLLLTSICSKEHDLKQVIYREFFYQYFLGVLFVYAATKNFDNYGKSQWCLLA